MNKEIVREIEPALLSLDEAKFLIAHVGEPTVVALKQVPHGVNPAAVRPILQRVNELMDLEKHEGEKWVGLDAIRDGLTVYVNDRERAVKIAAGVSKKQKGVALYPTLYIFDGKGKPHYSAPGSDCGYQRTYFDPVTKQRKPLLIPLTAVEEEWTPPWLEGVKEAPKDLIEDNEKLRLECAICNHTESFRAESRSSYNAARARMATHMKKTQVEPDLHKEYHTNVFGS